MPERLKKFRVENQLQLPRFVQTLLETARWTPRTRQRPQWTLPQTAMPQNLFHDVSLTAFDETDDFHPGPTLRALQRIDFKHPFDQSGPTRSRPARFGLGGRSCLIDKPPVIMYYVAVRRRDIIPIFMPVGAGTLLAPMDKRSFNFEFRVVG